MDCKHFGTCGGCSLPGMPYAQQLALKRARLAELLGIDVPPLIPSPAISAFRQKVAFVFGAGPPGEGLVMGHYARGSKAIVAVEECPVHSTRGNRIAFALRDHLVRARIGAADTGGILRHVIVRTSADDREAVAMLVVSRNDQALRAPIRRFLASADRPDGFFLNTNEKPGPYMVGRETIRIGGRASVREREAAGHTGTGAVDFLVSPTAFFQTNVGAARELVRLVKEGTAHAGRVLDLYAGTGLFALTIAQAGAAVVAVEEHRQAIEDLQANIAFNRVARARLRPVCARVEDALGRVVRDRWDAVVLDPPRSGCAPAVVDGVFCRIRPERAVYVSCNPEALAADVRTITACGYRISSVQAVDMFPHTEHIETVVTFRKGGGGRPGRDPDDTEWIER
jgi:23S rRNA (uracil1939-C5)-methyltransferase